MVQQWHVQKDRLGQEGLNSQEREELLYKLANICAAMILEKQGVVGDVARLIGGSLVAPPIDPVHIQCYFGDLNGFGVVDEVDMIVIGGVPVKHSSIRSRSRALVTVRKPQPWHRALAGNGKT